MTTATETLHDRVQFGYFIIKLAEKTITLSEARKALGDVLPELLLTPESS